MKLAAGCGLALALALRLRLVALAEGRPARHLPRGAAEASKNGQSPAAFVDLVARLMLDVSRLAMELYSRGGSRAVSLRRAETPEGPAVTLTFHRSAAEKRPALTEHDDDLGDRIIDYETSAFLRPLFPGGPSDSSIQRLPPPVIPKAKPLALLPAEKSLRKGQGLQQASSLASAGGPRGAIALHTLGGGGGPHSLLSLLPTQSQGKAFGLASVMHALDAFTNVATMLKNVLGSNSGIQVPAGGGVIFGSSGSGFRVDANTKPNVAKDRAVLHTQTKF